MCRAMSISEPLVSTYLGRVSGRSRESTLRCSFALHESNKRQTFNKSLRRRHLLKRFECTWTHKRLMTGQPGVPRLLFFTLFACSGASRSVYGTERRGASFSSFCVAFERSSLLSSRLILSSRRPTWRTMAAPWVSLKARFLQAHGKETEEVKNAYTNSADPCAWQSEGRRRRSSVKFV